MKLESVDVAQVSGLEEQAAALSSSSSSCTPQARRSNGASRSLQHSDAQPLKRTTLSNSLLDIHDPTERYQRRGSVGSLDSGMSVSFQSSTTNSTMSRDSSPKNIQQQQQQQHQQHHFGQQQQQQQQVLMERGVAAVKSGRGLQHQSSFLGNIFLKRERKNSRGSDSSLGAEPSSLAAKPTTSAPPQCTDV